MASFFSSFSTLRPDRAKRRDPISEPKPKPKSFTETDKTRFRNLLELANSSEYEGERRNAIDAARRLAESRGLTMEEAARWQPEPPEPSGPLPTRDWDFVWRVRPTPSEARNAATDYQRIQEEKQRRDEAILKARQRGLDSDEAEDARRTADRQSRPSRTRRNPYTHAAVLLRETSLPFTEIAEITGLDVYSVVGMKLKMRQAG
jgi:hypothetical protein